MSTKLAAVLGVVVSALIGVVTNVITSSFSWTLFALLLSLVTVAAILAVTQPGPGLSRSVRQQVRSGGSILRSPIRIKGGGRVIDKVSRRGKIEDSKVNNEGGNVKRKVGRDGNISGSDITIE